MLHFVVVLKECQFTRDAFSDVPQLSLVVHELLTGIVQSVRLCGHERVFLLHVLEEVESSVNFLQEVLAFLVVVLQLV